MKTSPRHVALMIGDGRKDNEFAFTLARELVCDGARVSFLLTTRAAWRAFGERARSFGVFSPPSLRSDLSLNWGLHSLLVGRWVEELAQRRVDVLFAILDYGIHAYLLAQALELHGIGAGITSRCIIPKEGTWEVAAKRLTVAQRARHTLRLLCLRKEPHFKRITRAHNRYFAWGRYDQERLLAQGVPPEHIQVSGCPLYQGMLSAEEMQRVAARRAEAQQRAEASKTAVVYSQPLERSVMLGSAHGNAAKRDFLHGIAAAGFEHLVIHQHPDEGELEPELFSGQQVSVTTHRNMPLGRRLELLQEHGWYFTPSSTSILEAVYSRVRCYLYQIPGLGPAGAKLPGFPVLDAESIKGVRKQPYSTNFDALQEYWIADADHSLESIRDWLLTSATPTT